MTNQIANIRKLNWLIQESTSGIFSLDDVARILYEMTSSNVYILDARGKIIGTSVAGMERKENTLFDFDSAMAEMRHLQVPIINDGRKLGTLVETRKEPEYNERSFAVAELCATVVGLEMNRQIVLEEEEIKRSRTVLLLAFDSLSHSECQAVKGIFKELEGEEGIIVTSRVADHSGITRSVIVNALRKLESGGVIETRSLGMKGTYIRVLNNHFEEELQRLE